MSAILQALGSGYNAKQILNYLSQHNPKLAGQISSSLNAGHTIEHVLNFISRNQKKLGKLISDKPYQGNIYKQAQSSIHPSLSGMAKFAGTAALAAGGAFALSRAAPQILQRGLAAGSNPPIQPNPTQPQPTPMPQNTGTSPNYGTPLARPGMANTSSNQQNPPQVINQTSQPPNPNQVTSNIPQPQPVAQPEGIINPREYLEKLGIKDKVDDLLKRGNSPEQTAAALGMKSGEGRIRGKIDPELLSNIDAYSKEAKPEENEQQLQEEKPTINKGSTVSSPEGIGEIKELRNGQALIDIDGKLHKVKEDELEPPLFSDDEVADAYDRIFEVIPEEHRSGFIQWAGYDEDRNVLGFIPRAGKYEELHDITPEEAQKIKEGSGIARTSGEEREGLWVKGEGTRGGVISQIIWDRKHKNKAQEEKQLKLGFELPKPEKEDKGMKPLFDEMAFAREKSREREKKKKEEERARKKKEKDEAKKRKK